ncbi:leucine-rich repeat-containing protein 14-like [Ptychodera flava]|uniref:leucine-rich repeat-containing protein 14-like n=1 Tax=Ptychodera flava TaxID=63121 RepID=UPI00396A1E3E
MACYEDLPELDPHDLDDVPCIGVTCPLPLVDICATAIVPTVSAVEYALQNTPREVNFNLLRMAILNEHFDSIKYLLVNWPYTLLDFKCLLHGYSVVPFAKLFSGERNNLPTKLTSAIGDWLPEILKTSNIQCLDISCLDTDQEGTTKLAQASIDSLGIDVEEVELLVGQILCHQVPFVSPPTGRTLQVNMCCTTDRYASEWHVFALVDALTLRSLTPISLHCRGLIMTESDLPTVVKYVEPKMVSHLEIDNCIDLPQIYNTVLSLYYLQSLDLPDFGDSPIDTLAAMLRSLPYLKRLNLMNTPLTSLVQRLLDGIQRPLEELNLSNCRLEAADFEYLAKSHHTLALKHLDIGSQRLDLHFVAFIKFLKKISERLVHLFLFDGHLSEGQIITLIDSCKFPVLRHWVLVGCKLYYHSYLNIIMNLASLPRIQHVSFSLPQGMQVANWTGPHEEWKEAANHFREEIKMMVQDTCMTFDRPRFTVEIARF